jgi:hypothetical protein
MAIDRSLSLRMLAARLAPGGGNATTRIDHRSGQNEQSNFEDRSDHRNAAEQSFCEKEQSFGEQFSENSAIAIFHDSSSCNPSRGKAERLRARSKTCFCSRGKQTAPAQAGTGIRIRLKACLFLLIQ